MSKFDELIIKACELVVAQEAENFDEILSRPPEPDWEPVELKVHKNAAGKIVIEDPNVLDLYELDGVEIDPGTGTPLIPGKRDECFGNGEHEGFARCCDACDHYLACFPECHGSG